MYFSGINKHGAQEKHLGMRFKRGPTPPSSISLIILGLDFAGVTKIHFS